MPGAIPRSDFLPRWSDWTWPPMTARARSSAPRSRDSRPIDASRHCSSGKWRTGLPAMSTRIRPAQIPPANRRAASTRMPTPMRSSGRSNQDARRSALTPPCFPPRPSRWPALPPSRGAEQRKAGRLDDARQTAACLSAFAKTLVRRDPDEAAFHLVLCAGLRAGIEKRLASPGLRYDRRRAAEGIGRSLHRVTSRPPKRGRAPRGRHSPGQAGRSRLRATFIAVSPRLSRTSEKEAGTQIRWETGKTLRDGYGWRAQKRWK